MPRFHCYHHPHSFENGHWPKRDILEVTLPHRFVVHTG
jgi:hypothetical protein